MIAKLKFYSQTVWKYITAHKIASVVVLVVVFGGGYYAYGKIFPATATTSYVLGTVTRGNLSIGVTGSGQVATLSQVDIKPKTTGQTQNLGQIISVNVKNGDLVKAGQVVAVLDGKVTLQNLNQAQASVNSAQANYNKLLNGPTDEDLQSNRSSIQSNETSIQNTKQSILTKIQAAYTSASNAVYLNTDTLFTRVMTETPMLSTENMTVTNQRLVDQINQERYKVGLVLKTWKSEQTALTLESDLPTALDNSIANLRTLRTYFDNMTTLFASFTIPNGGSGESTISSGKSTASSARANMDSSITDLIAISQSYQSALTSLEQSKQTLAYKVAPPAVDDLTVSKSQLDNAKAALANAQEAYASRIITAPFDGQIGGLTAQVGSQISSSDSLAKLITPEKVVNISLNEVDAAKIKANDQVNLTFDALPGVTVKGHVNYVDPLGTVTQGVVSYSTQIKLDEQNDQVKTGMTALATIVTSQKDNVLLVPASAITTIGGKKYVSVVVGGAMSSSTAPRQFRMASLTGSTSAMMRGTFAAGANSQVLSTAVTVRQVEVTTGTTNNISTEILSGLTEGETIVTRTITGTGAVAKTAASSATTRTSGQAAGFSSGGATRTFTTGGAPR